MGETATETQTTQQTTTAQVTPDWRAGLTGEYAGLATEKSLESFKGKDWTEVGPSLAKAWVETKKLVGAKAPALKIPDATSTPEEVALYRKAIGVPDDPSGYHFTRPEVAILAEWDEAQEQRFLTRMHQAGVPAEAVQKISNWYGEELSQLEQGILRYREAAMQELRREWGPDYAANLGVGNRAVTEFGGKALGEFLKNTIVDGLMLGDHPILIRAFAKIGKELMEAGAIPATGISHLTPEEAAERVTELQAELLKVPQGSEQARAVIDRIIQHQRIAAGRSA